MKTMKLLKGITLLCMVCLVSTSYGQDIGGILKRKAKKRAQEKIEKAVDKGLDIIEGKGGTTTTEEKKEDGSVVVVTKDENGNYVPIPNFINPGAAVFIDDFNTERPTEFPSKWTQLNGTMQNSQVVALGKKEGVVEFITGGRLKPTFKNDSYLGDSFKIEIQVYFHQKGNESYTLHLQNKNRSHGAYQFTIRSTGIVPAGNSSQYARLPYRIPPGWVTVQLSFNKGITKLSYNGYQLINIPRLNKGEDRVLTEFTHLEVSAGSPGKNHTMINDVSIAHGGLPLYKKLIADGKLVMNNINFQVNSYTLMTDSYEVLDGIATMLTEHPEISLNVHGHTDSDGPKKSNQKLSESRAMSVVTYLKDKGVAANRLSSTGYGESKPIDTGSSAIAKAKNRRVEFVLKQ